MGLGLPLLLYLVDGSGVPRLALHAPFNTAQLPSLRRSLPLLTQVLIHVGGEFSVTRRLGVS